MEMIKKYFLSEGLENYLIIWKYGKMFGLFGGVCLACLFLCFLIFIFLGGALNKNL